ncbi:hypothetical protein KY363_08025 [Candidatus Woesearchaeota archaeon]|nr:hypothetical protein [Candidatus Woesearchaeota archaeon]
MQKKRRVAGTPQGQKADADSRELLKSIIHFMQQNQQLSLPELINIYTESSPEESIPISVFSTKLSPSEALCKYLKENRALSFHEIAVLLNRDDRSVWTSYSRASRKAKGPLKTREEDIKIPVSIFNDRKLSIMEHVVSQMRVRDISNARIAEALNRNAASIATVANRAREKTKSSKRGSKNNG